MKQTVKSLCDELDASTAPRTQAQVALGDGSQVQVNVGSPHRSLRTEGHWTHYEVMGAQPGGLWIRYHIESDVFGFVDRLHLTHYLKKRGGVERYVIVQALDEVVMRFDFKVPSVQKWVLAAALVKFAMGQGGALMDRKILPPGA